MQLFCRELSFIKRRSLKDSNQELLQCSRPEIIMARLKMMMGMKGRKRQKGELEPNKTWKASRSGGRTKGEPKKASRSSSQMAKYGAWWCQSLSWQMEEEECIPPHSQSTSSHQVPAEGCVFPACCLIVDISPTLTACLHHYKMKLFEGSNNIFVFNSWYRYSEVLRQCTFNELCE